jgi:hypothetical protein
VILILGGKCVWCDKRVWVFRVPPPDGPYAYSAWHSKCDEREKAEARLEGAHEHMWSLPSTSGDIVCLFCTETRTA